MFVRVVLAGERICYVPSALVWHRHRADTHGLGEQLYSYGHGLGAYVAKRFVAHELNPAALGRLIRESGSVVVRVKEASTASQLGGGNKKLALNEVLGMAAGAFGYVRESRRAVKRSAGVP